MRPAVECIPSAYGVSNLTRAYRQQGEVASGEDQGSSSMMRRKLLSPVHPTLDPSHVHPGAPLSRVAWWPLPAASSPRLELEHHDVTPMGSNPFATTPTDFDRARRHCLRSPNETWLSRRNQSVHQMITSVRTENHASAVPPLAWSVIIGFGRYVPMSENSPRTLDRFCRKTSAEFERPG